MFQASDQLKAMLRMTQLAEWDTVKMLGSGPLLQRDWPANQLFNMAGRSVSYKMTDPDNLKTSLFWYNIVNCKLYSFPSS